MCLTHLTAPATQKSSESNFLSPKIERMKNLTIHQIWYRDEQCLELDPDMAPWDNRENARPEWCEYWIMRQAAQRFDDHFNELTGFFSWKYKQKLGLEPAQIEGFVQSNPGMDCYIFSPAVFQVAYYLNVWQQGEIWHKGITRHAQALLDRLGYCIDLEHSVDHHLSTAYANYWIASRPFWRAYLDFMGKVFNDVEALKDQPGKAFWAFDYGSAGGDCHVQALPMIPYLIERLFSAFVKLHPQFRIAAWEYPFDILKERAFGAAGMIPIANWCKLMFCETQDAQFLRMFVEIQPRLLQAASRALQENPGAAIR